VVFVRPPSLPRRRNLPPIYPDRQRLGEAVGTGSELAGFVGFSNGRWPPGVVSPNAGPMMIVRPAPFARRTACRRLRDTVFRKVARRYAVDMSYPIECGAAPTVVFERVLLPHRSLPPRGFHLLMLFLGLLSLAVGIGFVSIGAWPVCGFFGLDVGLIWLAFRISYRSSRRREVLRLSQDDFTVERVSIRGERRLWRFQPFWLRVVLEERADTSNRLLVASHGKSLVIGDFLPPSMRRELAGTLRAVLARWRAALNPTSAE
jgi:uncharacterized membrane protein